MRKRNKTPEMYGMPMGTSKLMAARHSQDFASLNRQQEAYLSAT